MGGPSYWSQHPPEQTEASGKTSLLAIGCLVMLLFSPILAIVALIFFGTQISEILSTIGAGLSPSP